MEEKREKVKKVMNLKVMRGREFLEDAAGQQNVRGGGRKSDQ